MSGIGLPAGWSSKRLKYLATYNDEVLAESTDENQEIDYVEISGVSLSRGIEQVERMTFGQAPSRARRKVKSGDVLISTVRTYLRAIAKVDKASPDLIASTGFCVVRPNDDVDSGFIGWAAKSEPFVSEVVARSVGVSYPAINASELVTIDIPLPPLDTQQRIARFLDEKTARIDGLIEKKRALLDRLAEKRQALITRAVTKGLNPDAPMKPSGIDWLGDIPAHWDVFLVKRRYDVQYGIGGEIDRSIEEGTRLLSLPNITKEGRFWLEEVPFTQVATSEDLLREGDLLFNWRNGSTEHLGKTVRFDLQGEWSHVSFLLRLRPKDEDTYSGFLRYFLNGLRETEFFAYAKAGVNNTFNLFELRNLPVISPSSFAEQREIAEYLDRSVHGLDAVNDSIRGSISGLEEYRKAVITAAVTGRIGELNGD
mgnify:FL=1